MTRVDFYILSSNNPPERFACMIAGKARQQGHNIYIHTNSRDDASRMDDLLWTHKDISFLPHNLIDDPDSDNSNISIGWTGHEPSKAEILINMGDTVPDFVSDYDRVVEMVPAEPSLKTQARQRYKQYRESGFELHDHKIDG